MRMRGKPVTSEEIARIVRLRKTGHSLPEIRKILGRGSSTVFKYITGVKILPEYISELKLKQGGSRRRADQAWNKASIQARDILSSPLSKEERLCLLLGLYWGEGNKKELNLINSDPALIKVFIACLRDIGIRKSQIKIGLRLHDDIDRKAAVRFWSNFLSIEESRISGIEVIRGNKTGKLKYGICRVRVTKGSQYFKLLMSLIFRVKSSFNAAVVQRIEQGTPKP